MELTQAERELIDLIRREDVADFTVTISADGPRFQVMLNDHSSGKVGTGSGVNFADAWSDIAPADLRNG